MSTLTSILSSGNQYVGPAGNLDLRISPALSDLIRAHVKYTSNLSTWHQYLIWRYTIGSGQVNRYLIGNSADDRVIYWVYQFFRYYNVDHYGLDSIDEPFKRWNNYFRNPRAYIRLDDNDKLTIAHEVLDYYIGALENIILNSPTVPGDIIVFKVSAYYPDLPETLRERNGSIVYQKPFNSTSYDPQLNFAPFLPSDFDCCLFIIRIPKGSHVLLIDPSLHAYPHEREILLPFGSSFNVKSINNDILNTVPVTDQRFVEVQTEPYVLGEVYRLDPLAKPNLKSNPIKVYNVDYVDPYFD